MSVAQSQDGRPRRQISLGPLTIILGAPRQGVGQPEVLRRAPIVPAGSTPWDLDDLRRLGVGLVLGAVGLLISWYGTSGAVQWNHQMFWIVIGIVATIISGLSSAGFLLSGFRAVRVRQSLLTTTLRRAVAPASVRASEQFGAAALVSARGMTRYHRPACLLVCGKAVEAASLRAHVAAGRGPCGVCGT